MRAMCLEDNGEMWSDFSCICVEFIYLEGLISCAGMEIWIGANDIPTSFLS